MTLEDMWKRVAVLGPSHVLLDKDGTMEMTVLATQKNPELQWDIIYFREDGLTLGCEFYLAQHAEALFRNDWIGWMRRGDKTPRAKNFRLDT